jgi:hypothetical protein
VDEPLTDLRWADRRPLGRLFLLALGLGVLGVVAFLVGLIPVGGPESLPLWAGALLFVGIGLCAASLGTFLGACILGLRRGAKGRAHTRPIVSWGGPGSRPEKGADPVPYGEATRAARARESQGPTPF